MLVCSFVGLIRWFPTVHLLSVYMGLNNNRENGVFLRSVHLLVRLYRCPVWYELDCVLLPKKCRVFLDLEELGKTVHLGHCTTVLLPYCLVIVWSCFNSNADFLLFECKRIWLMQIHFKHDKVSKPLRDDNIELLILDANKVKHGNCVIVLLCFDILTQIFAQIWGIICPYLISCGFRSTCIVISARQIDTTN